VNSGFNTFVQTSLIMGHHEEHHGHSEAQQNEIGGPVTVAIMLAAVAITIIYFLVAQSSAN
jgi:hypothetical protein